MGRSLRELKEVGQGGVVVAVAVLLDAFLS